MGIGVSTKLLQPFQLTSLPGTRGEEIRTVSSVGTSERTNRCTHFPSLIVTCLRC